MDWNAKWDWENLIIFNSKIIENPWKQPMDYVIDGEGEIDAGSFNLSGGGRGGSGSDLAHGSSVRSSISASTDSSSKEVLKTSEIAFEGFHSFPGDFSKHNELAEAKLAGTSPMLESSVGSGELLIGLKLGKRTYFENNFTGGNARTSSFSVTPVSSAASTVKKNKPSCQTPSLRCEVEGCNLDLSTAKEYYRKHRVCEIHSKCSKVVVGGLERRFCQQCSRFHSLSEFDEKKRSCRRRLSDHNARRRKPQQDVIQFNSARLSSPFLDGGQQMSSVMNNMQLVHNRSSASPRWESTCSSKFMLTNGYLLKSDKTGGNDGELQMPGTTELPHAIGVFGQNSNRLLPSKSTKAEGFSQGLKESMLSSKSNEAHDFHRALSLLSTDSWCLEPENVTLDHHPVAVNLTGLSQPVMHGLPQGLPLTSSEYWRTEHSADHHRVHTSAANGSRHFPEIQLFEAPYGSGIGSNLLN